MARCIGKRQIRSAMISSAFPFWKNSQTSASSGVLGLLVLRALPLISLLVFLTDAAVAETRTLRMYFTHTKESATITFKKNGKYLPAGLKKANRFLRDWRRKEPTKMDPALLYLVWEVYQKSGSRKPIKVISGYRSPRTNNMLRRRGRKVAKSSQHTRGKAGTAHVEQRQVHHVAVLRIKHVRVSLRTRAVGLQVRNQHALGGARRA